MKKSVKILSFFLVILMLATALPLSAFAAKKETYIKEIRISTASAADAAKKYLADNGYKVVDVDLNQKTGKDYVYIGYKTTTDPDEAITDISLMQMDGGYSFAEYEALLEQRSQEIGDMLDSLEASIREARGNYLAGKIEAAAAVTILNKFIEDDSGMLLGDFLLGREASREDLIKVFLQGNADITAMIYNALAMACTLGVEDENWLSRLSALDPYAAYDPLLYSDTATYLFESFVSVHELLVEYVEKYKETVENLDLDHLEEGVTSIDVIPEGSTTATALYVLLEEIKYNYDGGKTLLDFFLRDPYEMDSDELYPLVAAMSEGQRGIAEFVGFQSLIFYAQSDAEGLEKYVTAVVNSFMHEGIGDQILSVYYGVDRSLFEAGGVALSTAALRKSASTGDDSWFSGKNIDPKIRRVLNTVSAISAGMVVAAPILGKVGKIVTKKIAGTVVYKSALIQQCAVYQIPVKSSYAYVQGMSNEMYIATQLREGAGIEAQKVAQNFVNTVGRRILIGVRITMGVATAVFLIAEAVKIGIKVYNHLHPDYEEYPIPRAIVDEVLTDTDSYYVNYYAAKDQTDEYGDLNAWGGRKWLALYTTTDKKAGDPIIASSLQVKLKDASFPSDDHGAAHYFGETAAANLNQYQRSVSLATYIFYERDHSLSMTASTFTGGQIVMFTGFGLFGGVAIGGLGVTFAGKMKKKKESSEVE